MIRTWNGLHFIEVEAEPELDLIRVVLQRRPSPGAVVHPPPYWMEPAAAVKLIEELRAELDKLEKAAIDRPAPDAYEVCFIQSSKGTEWGVFPYTGTPLTPAGPMIAGPFPSRVDAEIAQAELETRDRSQAAPLRKPSDGIS